MANNIVIILDQSGSMGFESYFQPAQTDVSTFIESIMNVGDSLGVVTFNDVASIAFGSASAPTLLASQSTLDEAVADVMALNSSGNTNISAALTAAQGMIAGATGNIGLVFLSDGMWNVGGDPCPGSTAPCAGMPTSPPIYTIALGPAGEQDLLNAIATTTGGTYNYAPNASQLQEIYTNIGSAASGAPLVAQALPTVNQFKFIGTPGIIAAGSGQASFAVSWDDWSVVYTPNTPTGNEVNVYLTDPNGKTVKNPTVTASGNGFVVFKITSPMAGTYTAYAWYSGPGSLTYTAGILEDNTDIAIHAAATQAKIHRGGPIDVEVRLTDRGEPIDGALVRVGLEWPRVSLDDVLTMYASHMATIPVPSDAPAKRTDRAKLGALQRQLGIDLFPRQERPLSVTPAGDGLYRVPVPNAERAGNYVVRVHATGIAARSKTAFERSTRLSLFVS